MDSCDYCGRLAFLAFSVEDRAFCSPRCQRRYLKRPPPDSGRERQCPYCRKETKALAQVCPHCRRRIRGRWRVALRMVYSLLMLYFVLQGLLALPWPHH